MSHDNTGIPPQTWSVTDYDITPDKRARIDLAAACPDCADIPKVPEAGRVERRNGILQQVMHNGLRVPEGGYYGGWNTVLIQRLGGHHEPQEEKVFYEVLRTIPAGGTMVELGSYWAYYSAWFAREVPQARCLMVEPNPAHLRVGQMTFALNGLGGTFINAAAGPVTRGRVQYRGEEGFSSDDLPMVAVADLLDLHEIPFLQILHADIQGFEDRMLEGCARLASEGRLRYVFISTHGDKHGVCLDWLLTHGFHVIAAHSPAESYSVDGLIAARAPGQAGVDRVEISRRPA